jgi:hypothetical protein
MQYCLFQTKDAALHPLKRGRRRSSLGGSIPYLLKAIRQFVTATVNPYEGETGMTETGPYPPADKLTTNQTDELIFNAAIPEDGAIEDCEVTEDVATYLLESGAVGACRTTGAVEIHKYP